jgi:phage protein D
LAETPVSTDPRYRARPTVRVEDQEVAEVTARVQKFRVTEREGGMSSLELRLDNFGDDGQYAFEDESSLRLGSNVAVYSGDERQPREIFRGLITGIEAEFDRDGPSEMVVLAEDALQRARLARRTAVHDDATLSDLASDLARVAQLSPKVSGLSDNIGTQVQLNESDLAFMRRLLARYDGDLQVVGRELQVSARKDVQRGTVELELFRQLQVARFRVDLGEQATEVTAAGWDASRGTPVAASSRGANLGPGGGRSGSSLMQNAVGTRSEHVGHPLVATDDEARALADAAFDRRARRFVVCEGTAEGNPLIRVGTSVKVTGASARFNNTYYVVHTCHRYDGVDYRTDFEAECAYLGNP